MFQHSRIIATLTITTLFAVQTYRVRDARAQREEQQYGVFAQLGNSVRTGEQQLVEIHIYCDDKTVSQWGAAVDDTAFFVPLPLECNPIGVTGQVFDLDGDPLAELVTCDDDDDGTPENPFQLDAPEACYVDAGPGGGFGPPAGNVWFGQGAALLNSNVCFNLTAILRAIKTLKDGLGKISALWKLARRSRAAFEALKKMVSIGEGIQTIRARLAKANALLRAAETLGDASKIRAASESVRKLKAGLEAARKTLQAAGKAATAALLAMGAAEVIVAIEAFTVAEFALGVTSPCIRRLEKRIDELKKKAESDGLTPAEQKELEDKKKEVEKWEELEKILEDIHEKWAGEAEK